MTKRVLLVDDDPDIREIATLSLQTTMSWDVTTASTGEEALNSAEGIDVILLDVMMPGMDGVDTFRRLKQQAATRDIPVILLTAKVQSADLKRYESMGASGTVIKPFDPMQLGHLIAKALGWAH